MNELRLKKVSKKSAVFDAFNETGKCGFVICMFVNSGSYKWSSNVSKNNLEGFLELKEKAIKQIHDYTEKEFVLPI